MTDIEAQHNEVNTEEKKDGLPQQKGSGFSGFSATTLDTLVKQNTIVVFGTSTCPFSIHAFNLLKSLGIPHKAVILDNLDNGSEIRQVVEEQTNYHKVPSVFFQGKHIGGCNELVDLHYAGKLETLRSCVEEAPDLSGQDPSEATPNTNRIDSTGLFWFPASVNSYAVRATGAQIVLLCIFGIIFRNHSEMKWTITGLAADFLLRFLAGPTFSPLAAIAGALTALCEPKFVGGPPKQFAAFVGLCFSGLSAGLLLGGFETGASIVLAMLAGAAGLEAFLDFCMGCVVFSYLVSWGLVPKSVYKYYLATLPEMKRGWQKFHVKSDDLPEVQQLVISPNLGTKIGQLPIDPKIKTSLDEHKWFDVHVIRHMQVSYFAQPLTLNVLALVWYMMSSEISVYDSPKAAWHAIGTISTVLFFIYLSLYIMKAALYPQKVVKDWQHPFKGNLMAVFPGNLILLSFLLEKGGGNKDAAKIFFWIGACLGMLISVAKASDWFHRRWSFEAVNSSMLFHPLVAFFAAFVGPSLSRSYVEASYFWFSYGLIMYLSLFAVFTLKSMVDHHSDERLRPSQALFIITPMIATLSYQALEGTTGIVFRVFYYFAYFMFGTTLYGVAKGFFIAQKFSQSNWIWGIMLSALTAGTFMYDREIRSTFTEVWLKIMLAVTNIGIATLLMQTVAQGLHGNLFVPEEKWGPMSFMKLTHEAFRGFAVAFNNMLASSDRSDESIRLVADKLEGLLKVYDIHANQEDLCIFPMLEKFSPGITTTSAEEHKEQHLFIEKIKGAVKAIQETNESNLVENLSDTIHLIFDDFPPFYQEFLKHLRQEESFPSALMRKYASIDLQKETANKCWNDLSYEETSDIVSWVLENLELPGQRIRFLKSLMWSRPTHCEQLGMIVYRNVDDVLWTQLSTSLPEMIPRGLAGWRRYY